MKPRFTLRPALLKDIPAIFDVRCSVTENHMSREELLDCGITQASVADMLRGGDFIVPVACLTGADTSCLSTAMHKSSSASGSNVSQNSTASYDNDTVCAPSPIPRDANQEDVIKGDVLVAPTTLGPHGRLANGLERTNGPNGGLIKEDVPVGFGMAQISEGYIFALFVEAGYEGLGLGRALLTRMEQGLARHGVKQAWLVTGAEPTFRAHGIYRHMGWEMAELMEDGQRKFTKQLGKGV